MNNIGNKLTDHEITSSFWKRNSKTVPGRPSPKKDRQNKSSFQNFQESVNDAWDIGDDEFCAFSDIKISKKVSQSAAINVINTHRSTNVRPRSPVLSKVSNENVASLDKQSADKEEAISSQMARTLPEMCHIANKHFPGHPRLLRNAEIKSKLFDNGDEPDSEIRKLEKFQCILENTLLNLDDLRQLSWSGIPIKVRATAWRLLSGYLPASLERRQQVLERKRLDYLSLVNQYCETECDEAYKRTYRQIHIDVLRMSPILFEQEIVRQMFERILLIWAIRHPASGYVQGINDLVTPFYIVFLQDVVLPTEIDLSNFDVLTLQKEKRDIIEADSFWCLSKFLDGIQDNYIFAQLGIQQKVNQLKDLIQRKDGPLHQHLQNHEIDYLQFSFRWMHNLLTRELPLHCTIRLWDIYLAESDDLSSFLLYVCAAFLLRWRKELLLEKDFQGLMMMLQNLPTENWTYSDISLLVAEAYQLKFMFADAPNHLLNGTR